MGAITADLEGTGCDGVDCVHFAPDRAQSRAIENLALNFWFL
jgi:hypothetical protein